MRRNRMAVIGATLLFVAAVAIAQAGPGGPPPGPPGGGPGVDAALAKFLVLTDAQLTSWKTFQEEVKSTIEPLIEQQKTLHSQLQTALNATSPDAATVGQLVISGKGVSDQIRAAHDALDAKLRSVLTAEQALKFDAFRAAQQAMQGPGPGQGNGPGKGMGMGMGGGMAYGIGKGSHMCGGSCVSR